MRNRTIVWIASALLMVVVSLTIVNHYFSTIGGSKTETITIEQLGKPHNYKIKAPLKPDQYVHNLKIAVRGSINDTAMLGNVKLLPGKVDTIIYNSDWYAPDYELKYKPCKATGGSLKVELTFSYLQ